MEKIVKLVREFMEEVNKNHISAYASSCAFFLFLSMIPILLLICAILPYTPLTQANLVYYLNELLPDVVSPIAVKIVYEVYDRSVALVSATAIGALWSAGKGMLALLRGLNTISGVRETRNYIFLRIRASIYTLVMLLSIILSLIIVVFGKQIVGLLVSYVPQLQYLMEFLLSIRHVFTLLFLEVVFVAIFTWLPNRKIYWKYQVPGALLVGICWIGSSSVFSFYIARFAGLSMYGSISTLIIVMLWLYICMYIILLGALLNKYLEPATRYLLRKQKKETDGK